MSNFHLTERETEVLAEYDLQQQQQETEDDGILEFQRKLIQKPEVVLNQIKDACLEPKRVGRCKAHFPRYFFSSKSGRCERFTYGGCDGTGNNFESLTACEERCKGHLKQTEKLEEDSNSNGTNTNGIYFTVRA
jgi:hypothetical protein